MSTLARSFRFARQVPPGRILRRLSLMARQRLDDRRGARPLPLPEVALAATVPAPVFAPRSRGAVTREGGDLVLRFLNRPARFAGDLPDWGHPEGQLWRMMLHYMDWLEELGAEDVARVSLDWIAKNGTPQPGAWRDGWTAYALSIRVVVWLQQLARHRAALPAATVAAISDSAARQLSWLERHLETDIGGNHLIKNLKALLWGAACFEGEPARRWRAVGLQLLRAELARQVLPDGVHYERSPAYHCQVLVDLIECRAVLGEGLPALDAALPRMAQAAADLAHGDGRVAQFNDAGLAMAYAPGDLFEALSGLGLARPAPRPQFAYRDAGYYGLHRPELSLIADCGPLAPDDLPAHGQGDILSFELSCGPQRVIVDQGVYDYVAGPRRQAARAAASHNTLSLAAADQAEFFGVFRIGRRPRRVRAEWREAGEGFVLDGCHDGYAHLPGHPVHHRRIVAGPARVEIEDRLEADRAMPARLGFLLHPRIAVEALTPGRMRLSWDRGTLLLESDGTMRCEPAVWWPDMGCECATTRITVALDDARRVQRSTITLARGAEGAA